RTVPGPVARWPTSGSTAARPAGSRSHRRRGTPGPGTIEIQAQETAERWARPWWAVFLGGLVLWGATIAVARITHNIILLPTIILLGSFLVPITAVVWYLDHDSSPALSP